MHEKGKASPQPFLIFFLYSLLLCAIFPSGFSAANQPQVNKNQSKSVNTKRFGSSVIFPLAGNVYPIGFFHATLNIGNPPKPYFLDIDTGSDLTWLQCDAPCSKCTPSPHTLYIPKNDLITCVDPLCASLHWPNDHPCEKPEEQCDYEIEYADHGSSMGVLVKDSFPFRLTNGRIISPRLAFGCGYNQDFPDSVHPPYADGVFGLGKGELSVISQLHGLGLMQNVVGHCLSTQGGGFLFFGDDLVPSSGIVWTPLSAKSLKKHYTVGPAELLYNGKATGINGLPIVFDSGCTYSYFNSQAYKTLVSQIKKDLAKVPLKDATEDRSLPMCWKGAKPFKSIHEVKNYFKPLGLKFMKAKNVQFQLPPEAYLIVTDRGNVCLGILNGTEVDLENFNIIGDISLQNKMVIYDREKQQIGWLPANCDSLPKVGHQHIEGYAQPSGTGVRASEEQRLATHEEL